MSDGIDVHLSGSGVMNINIILVNQFWNELPVKTLPSLVWQNVAVENIECKISHPNCSDDYRVVDILFWSTVLTIKIGNIGHMLCY